MDTMPIHAVILQSWPEVVIVFALGLALVGYKASFYKLVLAGAIFAIISYFVRSLPLLFGIHSIIQVLVMILLVRFIISTTWQVAIAGTLLGTIALGLGESLFIPMLSAITKIPYEIAVKDPWLRVIFPYPHMAILAIIAYMLHKRDICLMRLGTGQGDED